MSTYVRKYHYAKPEDKKMAQALANDDQVPAVGISEAGKVLWRVKPEYRFLRDIERRNIRAGGHWFEPATMRFFASRVHETIYVAKDGRAYFVSSERPPGGRRGYAVRVAEVSGNINTVGSVCQYKTGRAAHAEAARLAAAQ